MPRAQLKGAGARAAVISRDGCLFVRPGGSKAAERPSHTARHAQRAEAPGRQGGTGWRVGNNGWGGWHWFRGRWRGLEERSVRTAAAGSNERGALPWPISRSWPPSPAARAGGGHRARSGQTAPRAPRQWRRADGRRPSRHSSRQPPQDQPGASNLQQGAWRRLLATGPTRV